MVDICEKEISAAASSVSSPSYTRTYYWLFMDSDAASNHLNAFSPLLKKVQNLVSWSPTIIAAGASGRDTVVFAQDINMLIDGSWS